MESFRVNYVDIAVIGAFLGYIFGFIPVIYGIVKRQVLMGILGLVASIAGGAALGVFLSLPLIAFFIWLIEKRSAPQPSGTEAANDTPDDLPVAASTDA